MMKARWAASSRSAAWWAPAAIRVRRLLAAGRALGFTKSLAQEVGRNITTQCVAPGFVDTDMTALPDAAREAVVAHPLGRSARQDIAHAVAVLASPGAGYVTGATLHVNGGMYMT